VLAFGGLLAVHAACGLGRGLESGHRDVGSALGAMAKASGVYTRQSSVQGTCFGGLTFIQGKFQVALGGDLGGGVLRMRKVRLGHIGAAVQATALLAYLGQEGITQAQYLGAKCE